MSEAQLTANTKYFNFGQKSFTYTPPAGFKALSTANFPTPAIVKPNQYFDAVTYTGNGTSQPISGLGFQPDLTWIKERSTARSHFLFDSIRGPQKGLSCDWVGGSEDTSLVNGYLSAFNANGFSLTNGSTSALNINENNGTYVAWNWKAGGTALTNTGGTITSTVSANPTDGFSVVTFSGAGSAGTIGHGL